MPEEGNRFDPETYDDAQSFVYENAADLVEVLDPQPGEVVLDLGCGTGHLTADVADRGATAVGVDADPGMVHEARTAHPDCHFFRGDARRLAVAGPVDAVFSNAALHWIPDDDQDPLLAGVANALRPGGRFVAEMGASGNVAGIVDAALAELRERGYDPGNPWYFPTLGEFATRLEEAGLTVRWARTFERPTTLGGPEGLRSWLAQFGDALLGDLAGEEREGVLASIEKRLRPSMYDPEAETWTASYRRLRFEARRPAD